MLILGVLLAGSFLYSTYQNIDTILEDEMFQVITPGVPINQSCSVAADCACTNEDNIYCQMNLQWNCTNNICSATAPESPLT